MILKQCLFYDCAESYFYLNACVCVSMSAHACAGCYREPSETVAKKEKQETESKISDIGYRHLNHYVKFLIQEL